MENAAELSRVSLNAANIFQAIFVCIEKYRLFGI